MTIIPEKRHVH